MSSAILTVDLDAIADNWRALDSISAGNVQTGAVVKADCYGLGADQISVHLAKSGVQQFFVALSQEGAILRKLLGRDPEISVFSGHMAGDTGLIREHDLTPMLNSLDQLEQHRSSLPDCPYGIQVDTGMGRLGMPPSEWISLNHTSLRPSLVMSHLACADEPDNPMNAGQLAKFRNLTDGLGFKRSLAATGGILLGADYHFDMTRPGIGLYGAQPFTAGQPVVRLSIPVIQSRMLEPGDSVGYGKTWIAKNKTRIATVAAGYADGLIRTLGNGVDLFHGATRCPLVGRVSMDLITVDISALSDVPVSLDILCPVQDVDQLAQAAGTIGYEVLTSLGPRYERRYKGG